MDECEVVEIVQAINSVIIKTFGESSAKECLHQQLKEAGLVFAIVDQLSKQFLIIFEGNKPKRYATARDSKLQSCSTMFKFYTFIRNNFKTFEDIILSITPYEKNDLLSILQTYGEEVVKYWCQKKERSNPSDEVGIKETTVYEEESYARSLLTIGGGCIGEVWRKSKRRTMYGTSKNLSENQVLQSKILYDAALKIRQSTEEKTEISFSGIKIRDRGGLFIPKAQLNEYFSQLNSVIRTVLCEDGVKKHGHRILQAVADFVEQHNSILTETFLRCAESLVTREDGVIICRELQRKFTHALCNEFITSREEKVKGGNGLRDELYVLSKNVGSKPKITVPKNVKKNNNAKNSNKKTKPKSIKITKFSQTKQMVSPPERDSSQKEVFLNKMSDISLSDVQTTPSPSSKETSLEYSSPKFKMLQQSETTPKRSLRCKKRKLVDKIASEHVISEEINLKKLLENQETLDQQISGCGNNIFKEIDLKNTPLKKQKKRPTKNVQKMFNQCDQN